MHDGLTEQQLLMLAEIEAEEEVGRVFKPRVWSQQCV